jgi:hypothetical protein
VASYRFYLTPGLANTPDLPCIIRGLAISSDATPR